MIHRFSHGHLSVAERFWIHSLGFSSKVKGGLSLFTAHPAFVAGVHKTGWATYILCHHFMVETVWGFRESIWKICCQGQALRRSFKKIACRFTWAISEASKAGKWLNMYRPKELSQNEEKQKILVSRWISGFCSLGAKAVLMTQTKHLCLKHNFSTWHKALFKSLEH